MLRALSQRVGTAVVTQLRHNVQRSSLGKLSIDPQCSYSVNIGCLRQIRLRSCVLLLAGEQAGRQRHHERMLQWQPKQLCYTPL